MHEIYVLKESRLNTALSKVEAKINWLSENQNILPSHELDKWNGWHDLKDRLNNRLWDNWTEFKAWHWEQFCFNSY